MWVDEGFRVDSLVEDLVVVELKSVERLACASQTSLDPPALTKSAGRFTDHL
ncbi:MAG TPA: GxxExxY protein [Anaerolineae bacterium]